MAARLKELRLAAGFSQERLAQLTEVTLRTVQNWEYGKRSFDFQAAIKLSQALGVSLNELAGIESAEAPAARKKGKGK